MHRDIQDMGLVGDQPSAKIALNPFVTVGTLGCNNEARKWQGQLAVEGGQAPRLCETQTFDIENTRQIVTSGVPDQHDPRPAA